MKICLNDQTSPQDLSKLGHMKMFGLRDVLLPTMKMCLWDNELPGVVLAQPLTEVFTKVCFNDSERAPSRDNLIVNFGKLFTSEDLSNIMADYSSSHIGYKLTINPWRHIQMAWKQKFKCVVTKRSWMWTWQTMWTPYKQATHRIKNRLYRLSTSAMQGPQKMYCHCFCMPAPPCRSNAR